ncbi:putative enzyme related to lactoylglutathione lyase [Lipingzhangella halophila]|uniref:Putative enzyme related to lactoylglutathione lyase n=1 Tax=Lipingzhangella halophila TaxID=1783352 RepID=A0A7W7RLL2_9ACTN|nr:VOC family protein [Lipingzhangella halophila]MBB4934250.1 putative enzyme related to lactoylglutathione lyase [Lipingzhangella halophila]
MFTNTKAFSGFSVDDTEVARSFYSETLGIRGSDVPGMEKYGLLTLHIAGDQDILVYPKPDHTPASFTILNFPVDDIDAAVDELGRRGVRLLRYDAFEHDEKGVVRGEYPLVAWFTDPAGNVLSVVQDA